MKCFYKYLLLAIISSLPVGKSFAQGYPISAIPDSLKDAAVAVIRNYSTAFSQSDKNNGTYDVTQVITILDKRGDAYANFSEYGDKFREMKSFSATITDAYGKVIKKVKKGDLTISTISDGLASDDYYIYYKAQSPSYPFTVEYTYQLKFKNGIISYPRFAPCLGFEIALEKADSRIELPADINLRYKANYDCNIKKEKIETKNIYTISLLSQKAKPWEPLAPSFRELLPSVLMTPSGFCYDSQCGDLSSWQSLGAWTAALLNGRDILPPDLVTKLHDMTKDIKNDREKVKIIYEYLQNNSRYVSIQLGIGGLQPIEAAKVAKNKFGDCKGLSNLMKAMLKAVDIPSNYCVINMSEKEKYLYSDFSNINQTNHVILLVPLKNDSIWLECTSQTLPFGYIHDNIVGHDAHVIAEDGSGGKLCHIPQYADWQNNKETKLLVDIKEDGGADGNVTFIEHLHGYADNAQAFRSNDREKQIRYINTWLKLPQMQIGDVNTSEDKSSLPSCLLTANFQSANFANRTGSRLFVPLSPLYKGTLTMFSAEKREWDIEIDTGFSETDTIIYTLPQSYVLESLPKNIDLSSAIGSFKTEIKQNGNKVICIQKIDINSGHYSKDLYPEIKIFYNQLSASLKRKLVLRRES